MSITSEIYKSFDNSFEVKGVFLDIFKAFDKVWREGLIYKLKQNGISGKIFKYNERFLRFKKTESGTKRATFILGKYYSRGVSRFNFKAFGFSYLH